MRKTVTTIILFLLAISLFAGGNYETEISAGAGYGLQSMGGTAVHGIALDFYGASTWNNNVTFFCWDSFEFPLGVSSGGLTMGRGDFDSLFGLDILCGAGYTFGRDRGPWTFSLGGGLYLGWLLASGYGISGNDFLFGLGAMARGRYHINERWFYSLGLKASFIFLDLANSNGNHSTLTGAGASVYAAFSAGVTF